MCVHILTAGKNWTLNVVVFWVCGFTLRNEPVLHQRAAAACRNWLIKVTLTHSSERRRDDWSAPICVCISVFGGQVKEAAVTETASLWSHLKLRLYGCMRYRVKGSWLSSVFTTQHLCLPPSINRDSHSFTPPIHQSSQRIATGKKKPAERASLNETETL